MTRPRAEDTHDCPGCGRPVPRSRLSCPGCWSQLPAALRGRITRAYNARRRYPHDGDLAAAHRAAMAEAFDWYRANRAGPP